MPGPLDVPEHVLIHTLSFLDMKSLRAVGATCRTLHSMTTGDEFWRYLFLSRYDDPRKAGAFPVPRQNIAWKKAVEREAVIGFLESHRLDGTRYKDLHELHSLERLVKEDKGMLIAWAPRVLPTVLDLFLDLPPPGYPSVNIPILVSFIAGGVLSSMCHTFKSPEADQLEVLFNRFSSFRSSYRHRHKRSLIRKPIRNFDSDSDSDSGRIFDSQANLEAYIRSKRSQKVPWDDAAVAATLLPEDPAETRDPSDTNEISLQEEFHAFRGEALSVLASQAAEETPAMWDWAGVGGLWQGQLTRWSKISLRHGEYIPCDITDLFLNVVESRDAVERACPVSERTTLWSDFGIPVPVHDLTPIYFHGTCLLDYTFALIPQAPFGNETPSPGAAFVHGMVYLDSKRYDPPQVKYTIAITGQGDASIKWRKLVYHGLEPWGPRSGAGVFGPYYRGGEDEYRNNPTGYMWLRRV